MVLKSDLGVVKHTFVEKDELLVNKWRDIKHFFEVTLPEHMEFAQCFFGLSVRFGVRVFDTCPLKMSRPLELVENWHQINAGDVVNVIPFEAEGRELIHHGMKHSFIPASGVLTVMNWFHFIHSVDLNRRC